MNDIVNQPPHYTQGNIECIDAIRSMVTPDQFLAHCRITAMQYIWRAPHKNGDEDLQKAIWYLRMAIGDDPRDER